MHLASAHCTEYVRIRIYCGIKMTGKILTWECAWIEFGYGRHEFPSNRWHQSEISLIILYAWQIFAFN